MMHDKSRGVTQTAHRPVPLPRPTLRGRSPIKNRYLRESFGVAPWPVMAPGQCVRVFRTIPLTVHGTPLEPHWHTGYGANDYGVGFGAGAVGSTGTAWERGLRLARSLTSMGLGAGRIVMMPLRASRRSQAQATCAASRLSISGSCVISYRTCCIRLSCANGVRLASPCGSLDGSGEAASVNGRVCACSVMLCKNCTCASERQANALRRSGRPLVRCGGPGHQNACNSLPGAKFGHCSASP